MDVFRVRLNCIDHYQSTPTRFDPQLRRDIHPSQFSKEPKVPVVRVFGSTETGQKVCAHIHGAFPYLFVEYKGSLADEDVGAYIYRLHLSIDHALAVSYRRDVYGGEHPKFVARITLVKGVPFYGFHVGYRYFLKIYMFNPIVMTRLADLLQQGMIMNRKFQPFEAHLQYLLQFMTDFNLYGCSYIEAAKLSFRSPVPEYDEDEETTHLWHSQSIPAERITDPVVLPRVSHCSIEVDICVPDILNRKAVKERRLHHGFIEMNNPLPAGMKLVHSMAGLWKDETKRRKRRMVNPPPGTSPFPPEVLVSMSADPRDSQPQGWIHEEEYMQLIQDLVAQEKATAEVEDVSFDTFVQPFALEPTVKTVLESVEDLFPENLQTALGLQQAAADGDEHPSSSIVVDEKAIIENRGHEDDNLFPDDSDEEALMQAELIKKAEEVEQNMMIRKEVQMLSASKHGPATVNGLSRVFDQRQKQQDRSKAPSAKPLSSQMPRFKTISGFAGVCESGLRTGRQPSMPLPMELMDMAKAEGMVSRSSNVSALANGQGLSLKRESTSTFDEPESKRQKLGEVEPSTRSPTKLSIGADGYDNLGVTPKSINQQTKPSPVTPSKQALSSSKTDERKTTDRKLRFAVVKDPNDLETVLHLSQQSNSQRSSYGKTPKHVSFDPSLPIVQSDPPNTTASKSPSGLSSSPPQISRVTPPTSVFSHASNTKATVLTYGIPPPTVSNVVASLPANGAAEVIYQDAYYSEEKDVPPRMREYAGREFRLEGNTLPFLPDFDPTGESAASLGFKPVAVIDKTGDDLRYERLRKQVSLRSWEVAEPPPSYDEVERWWNGKQARAKARAKAKSKVPSATQPNTQKIFLSQIEGATPKNKHGFKYSQRKKSTSVEHEAQYMSTMSLEVHVNSRGKLVPNPEEDEVQCIFWCVKADGSTRNSTRSSSNGFESGMIVLSEDGLIAERIGKQTAMEVLEETTELDVMVRMVDVVRAHDPDILTGYEVHGSSWGYLIERARFKYDYNLCDEFSRMKTQSHGRFGKEADKWGFNTTSTIRVTGRHMINVWRAMRGELNLLQYTMENVAWHLLHRRIPHYSWETLTGWYRNGRHRDLYKVLRYYQTRTRLDIEILEENELIPRTSEQARLLGVDFFSVFSRGSQFKVESIMFRIAKPENFLLVSPSRKDVGGQNALECLPLVMEPQSAFYNSPLIVLDFQSLYPSVMIAYNLCYSTFLGRITNWRGMNKMGFTEYKRRNRLLELLKDHINIAANGMMYVKAEIRKSLLAKMLTEILETRVMVKSGMKQDKDDKTLQQLLNNRQLALKLLANVTYGYTSASFSGRMPCAEIADSIVQTGRETLERAIAYIHSVERWGAEVVYGDTDSLFVYLKGRTRDQAFDIGNEMAKAITDMNPRPIKLKFEKVYHPCVLLAKKRYVGYKYESKDQLKPDFDAKGIETVRRDGTPAEQKIEEKALRMLFETADLSQIKEYFQSQCAKIMRGHVSVQDFCFAKEVKLGTYSDRGPPPPGALISTRRMLADARAEPQYGERVPYVVIAGAPGARLIDRCIAPEDLLHNPHVRLDAEYYISKNLIPPLERIFNLVGANVRRWYDEMPRVQHVRRVDYEAAGNLLGGGNGGSGTGGGVSAFGRPKKVTLESYLRSASCIVCGVRMKISTRPGNNFSRFAQPQQDLAPHERDGVMVCRRCRSSAGESLGQLQARVGREERRYMEVVRVCQSCSGVAPLEEVVCDSRDCPVFYTRVKQLARLRGERAVAEPAVRLLSLKELEW